MRRKHQQQQKKKSSHGVLNGSPLVTMATTTTVVAMASSGQQPKETDRIGIESSVAMASIDYTHKKFKKVASLQEELEEEQQLYVKRVRRNGVVQAPSTLITGHHGNDDTNLSSNNTTAITTATPVYKPKFHKLQQQQQQFVNGSRVTMVTSSTSNHGNSQQSNNKPPISLDDRISAIINNNNNILSKLPEYGTIGRRRSHHYSSGGNVITRNQSVDFINSNQQQQQRKTSLMTLPSPNILHHHPKSIVQRSKSVAVLDLSRSSDYNFVKENCAHEESSTKRRKLSSPPPTTINSNSNSNSRITTIMTSSSSIYSGSVVTVLPISNHGNHDPRNSNRRISSNNCGGGIVSVNDYNHPPRQQAQSQSLVDNHHSNNNKIVYRKLSLDGTSRDRQQQQQFGSHGSHGRKWSQQQQSTPINLSILAHEQIPMATTTTAVQQITTTSVVVTMTTATALVKRPTSLPLSSNNSISNKTLLLSKSKFDFSLVLPSPETPRVQKPFHQVYNNGHAYTYLNFKISTRSSYTCLFRPQPMFIILQDCDKLLSMYSNWRPRPSDPSHLSQLGGLDSNINIKNCCYGSSPPLYVVATGRCSSDSISIVTTTTSSSSKPVLSLYNSSEFKLVLVVGNDGNDNNAVGNHDNGEVNKSQCDDYIYVRGRGRGKYICSNCGIRCKKPSMLRKHLKTHTDCRPYTCRLCRFSFKTKGNLTKHQKSKSHLKKCREEGIDPGSRESLEADEPPLNQQDGEQDEEEEDDEEDDMEDDDEDDSDSNNEDTLVSNSFEKEIAQSLLDLSKMGSSGQPPAATTSEETRSEESVVEDEPLSLVTKKLANLITDSSTPIDLSSNKSVLPIRVEDPLQLTNTEETEESSGCLNLIKRVLNTNVVMATTISVCSSMVTATTTSCSNQRVVATVHPYEFKSTTESMATAATTAAGSSRLHQPWLSPNSTAAMATTTTTTAESSLQPQPIKHEEEEEELESDEEIIVDLDSPQLHNKISFRPPPSSTIDMEHKPTCTICSKVFTRPSQLTLHMNIHYLERPFRCDPCGVSFRTKGHLIKHRRSSSHDCKVYLTDQFGIANTSNPRPFKCTDCKIAFRIHGHLAKHLRSKMHIMRMECLGKLPFGIYYEMEKSGLNLNEIDTTDCDVSLGWLQSLASRLYGPNWEEKIKPTSNAEITESEEEKSID